jgi:signal transduction histidine kinase/HAMP domain-containing protein
VTLLFRLFVLVAVALLPAIAIQAYNEFDLRRARQVEVRDQALSLARLVASDQQQIVQGIRQVLIALSELQSIKTRNRDTCNSYLAAMQRRFPEFMSFLATDLDGRSFCDNNGGRSPVDISDRAYFANVVQTGAFAVGESSIGLLSHRRVIQFALPFYSDDGSMGGVVVSSLSLDWLADYIARNGAPSGVAIAVTDRNGTYLARYPDNARFVGRKMPAREHLNVDDGTTADIVDLDGVERIVGFSALGADSGGLLVSFGFNKTQAFAEIQSRTQRGIVLIVLSTSLVLILTWLGARRFIHRPLGQLIDAANQWRLGDYARRVSLREKSEIGRVADAFDTMADALQRRERELGEAKEKAEEAAARITTIFESTTDSVVIVDRDCRISYLNERARAELAEGHDLIGMSLWDALREFSQTELFSGLREAMSTRRPVSFETFFPRRGVWYTLNAFPSDQGLAVYFRNITEHKRALEARRLIEEQLHQSQKMEAVGQLTGGIAHDFNNLLAVVSANLELIDGHAGDSDRVRRLAAAAQHAADRGAQLTTQLLAFSRRQRLDPRPVGANKLIREFQGLIQRAVGELCEVRLLTDEPLWLCHVDPAQLQTAVLNLALNGRDAMADSGVLEIETRNVILYEGSVPGCSPGSYVRLSVRDTGCGMSPEVRERAFEPFFTTKELGKGTGLGLSMVYGFVRQSGGHVVIESAPRAGTTVILYLPKAAQTSEAQANTVQTQAAPTGSERILMVEDDEHLLGVTSEILTELGYRVRRARNSVEALAMLESGEEFELVFSDVMLPSGMNGVELGREARRLNPNIKVLLTSGHADDVLQRHQAVDEFPVIAKPFRRAQLAQRLRSILREA